MALQRCPEPGAGLSPSPSHWMEAAPGRGVTSGEAGPRSQLGTPGDLPHLRSQPSLDLGHGLRARLAFGWDTIDHSHLPGLSQPMKQLLFIISTREASSGFPARTCTSSARWLAQGGHLEDNNKSHHFLSASAVPGASLHAPSTWAHSSLTATQARGCGCPMRKLGPRDVKRYCQD